MKHNKGKQILFQIKLMNISKMYQASEMIYRISLQNRWLLQALDKGTIME